MMPEKAASYTSRKKRQASKEDDPSTDFDDENEQSENSFLNSWSDFGVLIVPSTKNKDDSGKSSKRSSTKKKKKNSKKKTGSKSKSSKSTSKKTKKKTKKKKSKKSQSETPQDTSSVSDSFDPNGSFYAPSDDDWSKVSAESSQSSLKSGQSSINYGSIPNLLNPIDADSDSDEEVERIRRLSEQEAKANWRKFERSLSLEDVMPFEEDEEGGQPEMESETKIDSEKAPVNDESFSRGSFHAPSGDGWSKGISSNVKGSRTSVTMKSKTAKQEKTEKKQSRTADKQGPDSKNNMIEPKTWGELLHGSFKSPSSKDWSKIAPDSTRLSKSWSTAKSTFDASASSFNDSEDDVDRIRRVNAERSLEMERRKSERAQTSSKLKSDRVTNSGSAEFPKDSRNKSTHSTSAPRSSTTAKKAPTVFEWGNGSFAGTFGGAWAKVKPENNRMHESWPSKSNAKPAEARYDEEKEVERLRNLNAARQQEIARRKMEREEEAIKRKSERSVRRKSFEISDTEKTGKEPKSKRTEEDPAHGSNYSQGAGNLRSQETWGLGSVTSANSGNWAKVAPELRREEDEETSQTILDHASRHASSEYHETPRNAPVRAVGKESQSITHKAERALSRATEASRRNHSSINQPATSQKRRNSQEILQRAVEARARATESRKSWDSDESSERRETADSQRSKQTGSHHTQTSGPMKPVPCKTSSHKNRSLDHQQPPKVRRASVPVANPVRKMGPGASMSLYRPMAHRRFSDGNIGIYSPAKGGWLLIHPIFKSHKLLS